MRGRRISSRHIEFDVHVRPERLGLTVRNDIHRRNLEVGRVLDDSQIRDEVQKGDFGLWSSMEWILVKFDEINLIECRLLQRSKMIFLLAPKSS